MCLLQCSWQEVWLSVKHTILMYMYLYMCALLPSLLDKSSRHFFYPSLALTRLCDRLRTDYSPLVHIHVHVMDYSYMYMYMYMYM